MGPMSDPANVRTGRWLVLYDADCGVCNVLMSLLLRWDRAALLRPLALQHADAGDLLAELTVAERMASWHLISPSGRRRSGGDALPALLALLPLGRAPAVLLERFPALADSGYRYVAGHRSGLSRWLPAGVKRRARASVLGRERDVRRGR